MTIINQKCGKKINIMLLHCEKSLNSMSNISKYCVTGATADTKTILFKTCPVLIFAAETRTLIQSDSFVGSTLLRTAAGAQPSWSWSCKIDKRCGKMSVGMFQYKCKVGN